MHIELNTITIQSTALNFKPPMNKTSEFEKRALSILEKTLTTNTRAQIQRCI